VNVDPLTGAGNRHQLEIDTAGRMQNPAYGWHLVASIDIDRFKLTNDTWGHAAGDMVLVEIAQRLNNVVSGWKGGASGIHGAVIRICGDEFLMVLHAETPINEAIVRQQLDEIRTGHIRTADGRSIELAFSAGVVTVLGQADLGDLMQAANLACYEDKAQRRIERERHQHPAREMSHGPRVSDI
jgi:diguanylate cyclase (GGDEF)-like protein